MSKENKDVLLEPNHSFEDEIKAQEERIRQMTVSQTDQMRQALDVFDAQHETLIDYFAIIGFDNGQLRRVIKELLNGDHVRGYEHLYPDEQKKCMHPRESMGQYRVLNPSVLERFPQMERHTDFPAQLHDYFFEALETIYTKEMMETYKEKLLLNGSGKNSDEAYISHGCTDVHARHSYITTHIFFEDLRKI